MVGGSSIWKRISVFVVVLGMFLAPSLVSAQLTHTFLGMSPPSVSEMDMLRDQAVEKTVSIQRDLTDLPLTLKADFIGPDARFLRGPDTIEYPVGVSHVEYTFEIFTEGAATGEYYAEIEFLPTVGEDVAGGSGLGVIRGTLLKVHFSVTDEEVVGYEVITTSFQQTEEGVPISFDFTVRNTGNVEWRPEKIDLHFTDIVTGATPAGVSVQGADIDPIKPGQEEQRIVSVGHELPPGNYDVEISFHDNGEMVHSEMDSFIVFPEGTLDQTAILNSVTTNKFVYRANEKIKVSAEFANAGAIPTVGVLVTEVYSITDELVDILVGSERSARPGETVELSHVLTLKDPGDYRLVSFVEYGVTKVTEPVEIVVTIEETVLAGAASDFNILPLVLLIIASILFVIVAIGVFIKSRREKKAPPTAVQPAPPAPTPVAPQTPPAAPVSPAVQASTPEAPVAPVPSQPVAEPQAFEQTPPPAAPASKVPPPTVAPSPATKPAPAPEQATEQSVPEQATPTAPETTTSKKEGDDDVWTISL